MSLSIRAQFSGPVMKKHLRLTVLRDSNHNSESIPML